MNERTKKTEWKIYKNNGKEEEREINKQTIISKTKICLMRNIYGKVEFNGEKNYYLLYIDNKCVCVSARDVIWSAAFQGCSFPAKYNHISDATVLKIDAFA